MFQLAEDSEESELTWWRRRWFRLALIWGVWTIVGLVFASQLYFGSIRSERPMAWSHVLYSQFTFVYLWALATPLVLWLAERFPIERHNWQRHLLLHALFSVLFLFVIGSAHHILWYLNYGMPLGKPYKFSNTLRQLSLNFSENVAIYGLIVLLQHAFNYYNRYRRGELRAAQLETQLSQAQLQALKMQLHPHFLFNTLHSISALLNKDTEAARRMITRLGDFLRLTLENSGAQEVTLKQEIEFLRCYLEIERVRFQDRLTTHVEIEPQALDLRVPNLILQPIVENAIRHGIAPRSTPGRIEIRAERANGALRIQVKDNGPGLSENRSAEILFKKGLGLANTQARLEQFYGSAHRFDLANCPDGGLVVTLEIPSGTRSTASESDLS